MKNVYGPDLKGLKYVDYVHTLSCKYITISHSTHACQTLDHTMVDRLTSLAE